jgi:diaminopimelate decarboxylase
MKQKGVNRFGLHTMVASNELDPDYIVETARMLFELAIELKEKADIRIEFVNMGGGIGIPYKPEEKEMDLFYVSDEIKKIYNKMIVTCMTNLMRPALYGAYHHITVPGKENLPLECTYDVAGSLCENNDKFAIDRKLPELETGDLVVIHDTGAHGHAMGFNYNGKLRSSEILLQKDGSTKLIRRAETMDDYFATLNF